MGTPSTSSVAVGGFFVTGLLVPAGFLWLGGTGGGLRTLVFASVVVRLGLGCGMGGAGLSGLGEKDLGVPGCVGSGLVTGGGIGVTGAEIGDLGDGGGGVAGAALCRLAVVFVFVC